MRKNLYIFQILNYNGISLLNEVFIESISSIFKQSYKNYIVHLIDNRSTDSSVEEIHRLFPAVKITRVNKNYGYVSHNFGLKYFYYSDADGLIVMNNDIVLEFDFLENIDRVFRKSDVGVVMPMIKFNNKKDMINSTGLILNLGGFAKNRDYGINDHLKKTFDSNIFLSGACFCIKKDLLEKIGLFDYTYSSFYEDADLSARILTETDYRIEFLKDAVCYHEYSGSYKKFSQKKEFLILRNQYLFLLKYLSFKTLLKAKLFFLKTRFLKKPFLHLKVLFSLFLLLPRIFFVRFKRKFILKAKIIENFLQKNFEPFKVEENFSERTSIVSSFEEILKPQRSITFGIDDEYIGKGFSFIDRNFPIGRKIIGEAELFLESDKDGEYVIIYYPENSILKLICNNEEFYSQNSPFYFKAKKGKLKITLETTEEIKITHIGQKDG